MYLQTLKNVTCLLLYPGSGSASEISTENSKASLDISKNIIKIISALANNFDDIKGNLISTTDDGTKVYDVKEMDVMLAETQYVMIKSGGAAYYIANYSGDSKKLTISFAAFTAGVTTVTNADGNFVIQENKNKSTADKLVYSMFLKDTKVGSYTMEAKKEGTLLIGLL